MNWNFLCADMFPCEDSKTVSVCLYPEKRNHPGFVNISVKFFSKKFERKFDFLTKSWNRLNFVNISPTLVVDTSMERSSQALQHGNPKNSILLRKNWNWILTCILTCAKELKSFKSVSTWTYMTTSRMHLRPFEGRHLVFRIVCR